MELKTLHLPAIEKTFQNEEVYMKLKGSWVAKTAKSATQLCSDLRKHGLPKKIIFDLSDIKNIDTSGVWILQKTVSSLKETGHKVEIENINSVFEALSSRLEAYQLNFHNFHKTHNLIEKLINFGKVSIDIALLTINLIAFLGKTIVGIFIVLLNPRRLRFASMVVHIEKFGINALPLICLMSIALGLVLAYQGEEQLRRFGAEIYTINLVSISIVREVGILITAILVAGRSGSAITAEIGIMKLNQEIDALNTFGLSPMEILVIPRVLALIIVMPLLAFVSDLAGLLGGGIMVITSLNVSPELYIHRISEAITIGGFWIGILKAPLFGALIGVVSCFQGMQVKGTAESVGTCTTRSVVESIFLVTIVDALLSIFFSSVGI